MPPARDPLVRPRLEALDGIRFAAALLVMAFHFTAADSGTWRTPTRSLFGPLFEVTSYGWLGVQLFFMISGFVICMSAWGKPLSAFIRSRFIRLFPAYWFAIALTTTILIVDSRIHQPLRWKHVVANLPMTESFFGVPYVDPSYWTLGVELVFYVLFAIALAWRGLTYLRTVVFCVAWLALSLLATPLNISIVNVVLQPLYAPFFVAGMALYLIRRFGSRTLVWVLLAAAWATCLFRLVDRVHAANRPGWNLHWPIAALVTTGFFALLAMTALGRLSWIRGRWLTVAGALTYPLYLLHQQIGETIIYGHRTALPVPVLLGGTVGAMLALAWLVHRFVERPVAGWLRRRLPYGFASSAELTPAEPKPERPLSMAQSAATTIPAAPLPRSAHDPSLVADRGGGDMSSR